MSDSDKPTTPLPETDGWDAGGKAHKSIRRMHLLFIVSGVISVLVVITSIVFYIIMVPFAVNHYAPGASNSDLRKIVNRSPRLESLTIDNSSYLTDLTPLEKLNQLTYFQIYNCPNVVDFSPLEKLPKLEDLMVCFDPNLTDLSPFENLTTLRNLSVNDCNNLTSLKPIEKLMNLKELCIDDCPKMKDLSPLFNLPEMKYIHIRGCPGITKTMLDDLKKALPDCTFDCY